jgi:hypothetical protein
MEHGDCIVSSDNPSSEERRKIVVVLEKTNKEKPAPEDIEELRVLLTTYPRLWRVTGDLALLSQQNLLRDSSLVANEREAVSAGLVTLRQQLGYDDASMLEQIVIEQVLLSWLRLSLWEYRYSGLGSAGSSISQSDFWERRISAAQRRFLRACETLSRIRQFARRIPALQVNINNDTGRQVNIAGDFIKTALEEKGKPFHG